MKTLKINTEYILLHQALKLSGVISTGGEAKLLIQENAVKVNGAAESRRGRKLYHGDVFGANHQEFVISGEDKKPKL